MPKVLHYSLFYFWGLKCVLLSGILTHYLFYIVLAMDIVEIL